MRELTPSTLPPPFANYAHGTEIPANWRIVRTSGQLGMRKVGTIPETAFEQAQLCFAHILDILNSAQMDASAVAHIAAYVTDRAYMPEYMRARDAFISTAGRMPSSTLVIVSGFTRPEFKVEVEVTAAAP